MSGLDPAPLYRLLEDIEEALGQVFAAGLAYPDPELPDELASLAERAGRLLLLNPFPPLGLGNGVQCR